MWLLERLLEVVGGDVAQLGLEIPDKSDWTVLGRACHGGHTDAVEFLISVGVDVAQTSGSLSPVSMAVIGGHVDTVSLLLKKGSPVDATAPNGDTAL